MIAKRLRVHGRVHGVGYRHWAAETATRLGLAGWVRNRTDGTVEALLEGDTAAVEEMARACRRGPIAAAVSLIHEDLVEPEELEGFAVRPTA